MRNITLIIIGLILVLAGFGVYFYYDFFIKPDREARELITEGMMIAERGDKQSINNAIDTLTKVIAKYPDSKYVPEAYFQIAGCYEKLGLNRLAYLKYNYLLKDTKKINGALKKEILLRLARINVMKEYSEEAISQLLSLLNTNYNKEFRSRIYSELGHTYLKLRDYNKAKRMFDISLTEYGSNEEAILGQARALKWMGKDNDAYDLYEYFLKYYGVVSQYANDVRNSYREQAYNSGLSAFRKGQYQSAISYFARVLNNFPYHKISENALYWTGESYFAMSRFDDAIVYFDKVLNNNYYHKDEDARIKKGYSYFSSKRFDLAAREFQIYLDQYHNGKYAHIAKEWKEMSTKELLLRIENQKLPETKKAPAPEKKENAVKEEPANNNQSDEQLEEEDTEGQDEEISGDYNADYNKIKLENVAEL